MNYIRLAARLDSYLAYNKSKSFFVAFDSMDLQIVIQLKESSYDLQTNQKHNESNAEVR
jgi:hypothetical protein